MIIRAWNMWSQKGVQFSEEIMRKADVFWFVFFSLVVLMELCELQAAWHTTTTSSTASFQVQSSVFILSISPDVPSSYPTLQVTFWAETKHRDVAQISRFEAEASVKCIRMREGIKTRGGGSGGCYKAGGYQRDWYVICTPRWMEGSQKTSGAESHSH